MALRKRLMPPPVLLGALLALGAPLGLGATASCGDDEACAPYVAEVVRAADRRGTESRQEYLHNLAARVAAVDAKYPKRVAQCRARASRALQRHLVGRCTADERFRPPPECPAGWSRERCCQLSVLCALEYPSASAYCDWEPRAAGPPSTLPRCATCPGCVPEGTTPTPPRHVNLWLGGDRDTLAVVLDQPVNDAWLMPADAPPAHLEPMLYALWKQPGYLAPNVAIVQGEIVSVPAYNALEQALHQGGWGNLGLNLGQWNGRFYCPKHPPARRYTFPPGRRPVTVTITADALLLDGKPLLTLDHGAVPADAKGPDPSGLVIAPLRKRLDALAPGLAMQPGTRPDVLRVALAPGLAAHARLVAAIIFTSMPALRGAHARITCQYRSDSR
jgi:hypothetical protein